MAAAFLLSIGSKAAAANPFLPPAGKIFQGVAGQPPGFYQRATCAPARYPRASSTLRQLLARTKFPAFAPEFQP
jgi:hypothetical protein